MQNRVVRGIILAVIFGVALYTVIYLYAVNSDAYLAAEQQLISSEQLKSRIGKIMGVRLPIFGHFKQKWVGSTASAKFKVEVTGSQETVLISIKMKNDNGIWQIQQAEIKGRAIFLQKTEKDATKGS